MATGYPLSSTQRKEFINLISKKADMAYKVPDRLLLWDYHVDNIMLIDSQKNNRMSLKTHCAIIDFQDAMWGPVTYDIMSLIEDARREVSPCVAEKTKTLFFNAFPEIPKEDFQASFAFLSMFRHMRVLGRFTILMAVNGKDEYIRHIPHLWNMLNRTLQHPDLIEIKNWIDKNFPEKLRDLPKRKPIRKAMLMAAGRGTRMQEMTDELPKPLIEVGGKAMIDYNFERLKAAGIKDIVVNLCYKGEMIKDHLDKNFSKDFNIRYSYEEEALETGGGVKKALPLLEDDTFFILNNDVFSLDEEIKPALWKMTDAWDSDKYDVMLLLEPLDKTVGDNDNGIGNYRITADGKPERNTKSTKGFPYLMAGVSIVHKKIFDSITEKNFSMRALWDDAQQKGRLGIVINNGIFFHIGTPEAYKKANNTIRGKKS
jgi:MurNAc alpha-1-phosphate uridylyltransferase